MNDREILSWSSLRGGSVGGLSDAFGGGNGVSVEGLSGCGGSGLGVNVGGDEALRGGGDGGEDVIVFCADFEDANVVPHLLLLPLEGNEVVSATGFEVRASTVLTPGIS